MVKDMSYFKNQLRRMISMTIKPRVFIVSFLFSVLGIAAILGGCVVDMESNNARTDSATETLVVPWDLRDGTQSYFQVTNVNTANGARLHIQILDDGCVELFNYFDTYTAGDTHLYNVSLLDTNDGTFIGPPDFTGENGFIVVENINANDDNLNESNDLTGEYRVVYSGGWEYRSNAAGFDTDTLVNNGNISKIAYTFNFNSANGSTNGDVPIAFLECFDTPAECHLAPNKAFETRLYDENENQVSCPPHNACGFFGINQAYPSTFATDDEGNLCNGTAPDGHVLVVATGVVEDETPRVFRVGFVGQNDTGLPGGSGLGHMDVWNGVWDNMCTVVGNCPDIEEVMAMAPAAQ
jgi:hypothetical protein